MASAVKLELSSTASTVFVDANSKINADAKSSGNGGKVVVWADNHTDFAGSISSKGGRSSGDGGFVEVSGHDTLSYDGLVDLSAYYGNAGTLLLDPLNVVIGGTGSSGLSVSSIVNALVTSNVVVTTGATGAESGDITVASNITWTSNNSLSLNAYRNIIANSGVTVKNTGAGDLNLRADSSARGIGTVIANGTSKVDYSQSTGRVSLFYNPTGTTKYQNATNYTSHFIENGAVSDQGIAYMLVNNVNDLQNIQSNLSGNYALGKDINASSTKTWNGGKGFIPIGYDDLTPFSTLYTFDGIFNGNGKTISNLTIKQNFSRDTDGFFETALFGENSGYIHSLNVEKASVSSLKGENDVAILVGMNFGTISDVRVSGTITVGNEFDEYFTFAGGVAAFNSGAISRATSNITTNVSGRAVVGGLVGMNFGSIDQSASFGTVTGGTLVGGLVGGLFGPSNITNSYSRANVYGTAVTYFDGIGPRTDIAKVGGLVGETDGFDPTVPAKISKSYATGKLAEPTQSLVDWLRTSFPIIQLRIPTGTPRPLRKRPVQVAVPVEPLRN